MSPTPRAATVLGRFPAHFGATDPGKTMGGVADAFAAELDVKASQLAGVRRAHRLGEAREERDLLLLAALHGFRRADFELLTLRLAAARTAGLAILDAAGDDEAVAPLRQSLPDLVAIAADSFPALEEEADAGPADRRLGNALVKLGHYRAEMDQLRARVVALIAAHRLGNGSTETLLSAAATHLGLDVDHVTHHPEGYWHIARCRDRLAPTQPALTDLVAIEENPFEIADVDPIDRAHGARFQVTRKGWEEVAVTVRVVGVGDRTWGPMVVNLDSGAGVAFTGAVGDGEELRFEAAGHATLAGEGVSRRCYSFTGGVFAAGDAASATRDFVWADAGEPGEYGDREASFSVTRPIEDAFEPGATFPHPGGPLAAPTLAVGETRWGFFVQEGHFGVETESGPRVPTPAHAAGRWDESVFRTADPPPAAVSGQVGFEWEEREPFALCVWLPRRFETLDATAALPVREQVRVLLDRYRAAGVHVYVKYADDRWTLGTGIVRDLESAEPLGTVLAGTRLSPPPDPESEEPE